MTREDIIRMAREAGIRDCTCNGEFGCLERFANLVAAGEREACAKFFDLNDTNLFWGSQAAQHIRARGQE